MTDHDRRCDFCRQPLVGAGFDLEQAGERYRCCTERCRDALEGSDRVFTEYDGHRRMQTGVAAIDDSLPQGLSRNSFVLFAGNTGTREGEIRAELVWRALQRGEPAVLVAFTEPPISLVESFLAMDWNVLPAIEEGRIRIVDCFTARVDDRDRLYDRLTPWNRHLDGLVGPATTVVRDPGDGHELRNKLDNCLEGLGMVESGIVVIDSLVEFGSLVQPIQAYDLLKDVRAEVCKGRFVPVFGGATGGDDEAFPRDLEYVVDGVIDLRLDGGIVEDTLFRRLRVRKMRGVLTVPEWYTYEYTSGLGLVTFDPREGPSEDDDGERADGDGDGDGEGEGERDGGRSESGADRSHSPQ